MTPAELRRAAKRERERRARANRLAPPAVKVSKVCHKKQAALVDSLVLGSVRSICALAGRQSGKSHGGALATILTAARTPGVNLIYVTSTYASCEKMAFRPACALNLEYGLGGDPNLAKAYIAFPNGSVAYFMGADNEKLISRLRGTPNLVLCIIDEAGIYDPDTLKAIIEAVRPGLRPRGGKLVVMGTPSLQGKQGTFYDITESDAYEQHRFDYNDNDKVPTFADRERLIDEDLKAQFPHLTSAEARKTAWFKREYLALFEVDLAEMVYQLADSNLVDDIPEQATHATGGDLGVKASDALVTLGWNDGAHDIFVTDQEEASGQDSLAFADMAKATWERRSPVTMAIDPGGLGQKTIKTVKALFPEIPIVEAVKPAIGIQVRAVNTLLQSGRLKLKRGSKLAMELARPTWVGGLVGGDIDEHGKHSDLVPSLRYVCVAATPYLPDIEMPLTAEDMARQKHLEAIARSERISQARKPHAADHDPSEFTEDINSDLSLDLDAAFEDAS